MQKLAKALMAAQAEFKPVKKDATNPHFKSKYATFPAFVEGIRPVLAKHGLVVLQTTRFDAAGATVTLESTLLHVESGEKLESVYPLIPAKNDPQGLGSALTYAKRYAYGALTGSVADDEDDDANAASARDKKPEKKADNDAAPTIGEGRAVVWDTARKLWPKAEEHKARIRALLEKHGVAATEKLPYPKEGVVAYVNELNEAKRLEGEGKHVA